MRDGAESILAHIRARRLKLFAKIVWKKRASAFLELMGVKANR